MDRSRLGFSLIELMLATVVIGIIAAIAIPNYNSMQSRAREADVFAQAHTVQLAAECYCVGNDGVYTDQPDGLMPYLPSQQLMRNSFTGERTEPQFATSATTPGQVGIQLVVSGDTIMGYIITGYGRNSEVLRYHAAH